jgi:hypothetical protein
MLLACPVVGTGTLALLAAIPRLLRAMPSATAASAAAAPSTAARSLTP